MAGKLNRDRVRDEQPGEQDKWLNDGGGLYVRVRISGTKTFVLRRKHEGRTTVETLGDARYMSLQEAREKVNSRKRGNFNPSTNTVEQGIAKFYATVVQRDYKPPERLKRYLDRDLAKIHDKRVSKVTRAMLAEVLAEKSLDGPVAANRLLAIIKQLFAHLVEIGWLDESPATMLTRTAAGGKELSRDRVLSIDEIKALWKAANDSSHGQLYRWLLLSGQRIGEAQAARWRDLRGGWWHIPENKSGRPHRAYVSKAMQAILDERPRDSGLIFGSYSTTAAQAWLKRWCKREEINPAFTPHDLRRTMATRMSEIGIAPHVVEKILNHAMQGVMETYNRHDYADERKAAQEQWGELVTDLVTTKPKSPETAG